jgi:hypothetical protein
MLYKAIVEIDMIVEAKSQEEAIHVARQNAHEETDHAHVRCREVESIKDVPMEWRNSIPWGSDDDSTVQEVLTRQEGATR